MPITSRTLNLQIPLVIEDHPEDYEGYPFVTLVRYKKQSVLAIIDNVTDNEMSLYVLDYCGPENVNESEIIATACEWYENFRDSYPFSIEVSRRGLTSTFSKVYRSINIDFVTRVIGPIPTFDMTEVHSIKRRKKKSVPPGVKIEGKGSSVKKF